MDLYRKVAPTQTCIDPALVIKNQRVGAAAATAETDLIQLYIKAAERMIEAATNRSIMRSTYLLRVPAVRARLTLPRPGTDGGPVTVKALKTTAFSERGHAYDTTTVVDLTTPPRQRVMSMLPTLFLPGILDSNFGEAEIEYEAGATSAEAVDPAVRQAVLLVASHYYRNREAVVTDQRRGVGMVLPYGAEALIGGLRIPNVNAPVNEMADASPEVSI